MEWGEEISDKHPTSTLSACLMNWECRSSSTKLPGEPKAPPIFPKITDMFGSEY